jgi:Na+-driven multidrug efflux pump
VLDHNFDDFDETGWVLPLFVLVLVGYGLAGSIAQRLAAQHAAAGSPLTHGALAGIGVLVIWFPIRVLIWVARDEDRALFSGNDPALRPGQIFGHLVIATALGMLGAFVAARMARRAGKRASA